MTDEMQEFDPFENMSDDELDAMADDVALAEETRPAAEPGFRSGFVALVGRPNAGKSTLMNACMGTKVAITSPVAQTTRRRMLGVVRREGVQIVFVDTPGLHKPQDSLGSELNKSALAEFKDVDVLCFLVDASKPIGRGDAWVAERVAKASAKRILVLTKADLASSEMVNEQLEAARALCDFDDEIVVSAARGFNVEGFISLVSSYLPEGPQWFPDGVSTDASDEMIVAEFVREALLLRTREEVPHSIGVLCDSMERRRGTLVIHATIYVEREGQKGIIIGKRGEMIKHVGIDARRNLEAIFGCKVFLELDVRVKSHWREDVREIRRLGYAADE